MLTQDAKHVVTAHPDFGGCPVEVVPCSVNQQIFVPHPEQRALQRERFDFEPDDLVIAYLGSSGPLYCIDEVYKLVARLKDHGCNARLLFLGEHRIETHLQRARALGLAMVESDFRCYKVPHHEVPIVLSAADFGISFRIPTFSSLGVSATKVGEYMACGIPVITSKGIGDIERIIKDGSSGVVLSNFSDDEIERAAMLIVDNNFSPANQIRETTRSIFNIERAIVQYDRLYRDSNKSKSGVNNVRRTS